MTDAETPENTPQDPPIDSPMEGEAELRPEDWPESKELGWVEISARELGAYWKMVRRIEWMIGASGAVFAAALAWPMGWVLAVGLLAGTVLAWINFRWLAASVNAIGERIVTVRSQEGGAAVVVGGVGRIFLIVLFAYVTFTCSPRGFVGYLAGLAMPVVALMLEAVYEFVAINRT